MAAEWNPRRLLGFEDPQSLQVEGPCLGVRILPQPRETTPAFPGVACNHMRILAVELTGDLQASEAP